MNFSIQSLLVIMVETICCKLFYEALVAKKYKDYLSGVLCLISIFVVICLAVVLLSDYLLGRVIAVSFAVALIMSKYMKLVIWKSTILALIYSGLLAASDLLSYALFVFTYRIIIQNNPEYVINWNLGAALSKLITFIVILLLKKFVSKNNSEDLLRDEEWPRFIVFPIITFGVIVAMMGDSKNIGDVRLENVYVLIGFGLVALNVIAFYLIGDIVKRERRIREDDLFREKVRNQADMYRSVYDNYELQRKRAHEYKNQIMCMEALLRKKEYGELEKYISEIGGKLTDTDSNINTNNSLIDAIINTKYREMEDNGILLVLKFNEMANLWIEDEDIVVILSNLLNNAIEACEKCDQKTVKLKLMKESDEIIIAVRNTYNGEVVKDGDEIRSLKSDNEAHGFGIKNIIEAVEKYGGSYSINYDYKEFAFSICIPKP